MSGKPYIPASRRYRIPAACVAGLLLILFGCEKNPGQREYLKGVEEFKAGHWVRARAALQNSLKKQQQAGTPRNPGTLHYLGIALWKLEKTEEAASVFREYTELAPDRFDALYNYGMTLAASGQTAEAVGALTAASFMKADDTAALQALARIQMEKKNWEPAKKTLLRALERDPQDPGILNALAIAELHIDGSRAAIPRLTRLLADHPDYLPALHNLGMIYCRWLRNPAQAEKFLGEFIRKSGAGPLRDEAEKALTDLKAKKDLPASQPAAFNPAKNYQPTLTFRKPETPDRMKAMEEFRKGYQYYMQEKYADAIRHYTRAAETDPQYEDALFNLGSSYYANRQYNEARDTFHYALRINPSSVRTLYMIAATYYNQQNHAAAEKYLQAGLAVDPADSRCITLLDLIRTAN